MNGSVGFAAGDLNGDGNQDLVVVNMAGKSVTVLLGKGNGTFSAAVNYPVSDQGTAVALADLNGDGKLDVAVSVLGARLSAGNASVLLGNGDGTLQAARSFPVGYNPVAVVAGDLNNDGHPDLVVINAGDVDLSVLLGNGDGTFQKARSLAAGPAPMSLALADLNHDGRLDLLVGNYNAEVPGRTGVAVELGNGDGTFQKLVRYDSADAALSIAVGDFNRDGKLDVAVADFTAKSAHLLLGNGDGTLQGASSYAAGLGPANITAADFNHDGALDLAIANPVAANVWILLNMGVH